MLKHKVRQGECMGTIAPRYGFLAQTLWDLPENADLKEARQGDLNTLAPGDEVTIPDRRPRDEAVPVDSAQAFQLKVVPMRLRLQLRLEDDPRAAEAYALEFDTGERVEGSTDGDGWIDQPLPPRATQATLELRDGEERYTLAIGHLDPADMVTGTQARLHNLGHYFGAVDGDPGPQTAAALKRFQRRHDLEPTGEADEATVAALRSRYGG